MKHLRSMLFIPGNNPGMLVSADLLDADAVIFDLEDAVAPDEKDAARDLVHNALINVEFEHALVFVRINPTDSPYWHADLEAVLGAMPDGLVIPKASVASVRAVDELVDAYYRERDIDWKLDYYLLVETAAGVVDLERIATGSERIGGLLLGGEDYSVSMGINRTKGSEELSYARFKLATVARAFDLDAIDTPFTDIDDTNGLIEDTRRAKSIGFNGKLIINPRQIPIVHELFSPGREEIEQAQAILSAAEAAEARGEGVFSFKGKMVDKPVIDRARRIIRSAEEWGLL